MTRADDADLAYRVANGVARVARASAYVTGGALVAANGADEHTTSNDDSRYVGWATEPAKADPGPSGPSPVVTFPDLTAAPRWVGAPGHPTDPLTVNGALESASRPTYLDGALGDVSGHASPYPAVPPIEGEPVGGGAFPGVESGGGFDGIGFPGPPGNAVGTPVAPGAPSFPAPGVGGGNNVGPIEVPGFNDGVGDGFLGDNFLGNDFLGDNFLGDDFLGDDFLDGLDGLKGIDEFGELDGFNGIGDFYVSFEGLGVEITGEVHVGLHAGADGVWVASSAKGDIQLDGSTDASKVGSQIDADKQSLGSTTQQPLSASGKPGTENTNGTGLPSSTGAAPGASSGLPGGTAAPTVPVSPTLGTSPALTAPTPAPAVVAPAPIAPAAPVAPAAPSPVTATPLQTTIQPDAASTPIANVLGGTQGSGALTAPAAAVPAIFTPPPPTKSVVPQEYSLPTVTTPTVAPVVTPPSTLPTADQTPVKLPDLPKATVAPTIPDITKAPITVAPVKPLPVEPDPTGGITTPSVPTTPHPTPTVDLPTQTVPQPTVTVPTQQPTVKPAPTVDAHPPTVTVPTPVAPVQPTPVQVKPLEVKPIADHGSYNDSYHGVTTGLFNNGWSSTFDPHAQAFVADHHGYDIA
ncbi:hypothetical protein [Nocardia camponoti]|uniref:Uncharacterized protein n=1 Tax=Nocardia camponoti TaxID=1616106 RepID=A0A917QPZ3_9NOCA|nr:hypothetical protein [Nocardia camponoti]GGK62766.1 hypothetical protein GCM10011591_38740 [Nocardia camponoti]